MIKLIPDPTFEAEAALTVPGLPEPAKVPMTFRYMDPAEVAEWFTANKETKSADALDKIIVSWSGVMGEDGQSVPYSKEALATLLKKYPPATGEIISAWRREMQESRVKN